MDLEYCLPDPCTLRPAKPALGEGHVGTRPPNASKIRWSEPRPCSYPIAVFQAAYAKTETFRSEAEPSDSQLSCPSLRRDTPAAPRTTPDDARSFASPLPSRAETGPA